MPVLSRDDEDAEEAEKLKALTIGLAAAGILLLTPAVLFGRGDNSMDEGIVAWSTQIAVVLLVAALIMGGVFL